MWRPEMAVVLVTWSVIWLAWGAFRRNVLDKMLGKRSEKTGDEA